MQSPSTRTLPVGTTQMPGLQSFHFRHLLLSIHWKTTTHHPPLFHTATTPQRITLTLPPNLHILTFKSICFTGANSSITTSDSISNLPINHTIAASKSFPALSTHPCCLNHPQHLQLLLLLLTIRCRTMVSSGKRNTPLLQRNPSIWVQAWSRF